MSKKLVIKINNLAALDEDALARKHEVEQLLWGRIIGAIAAGLVLLLLAVWFVFAKLESPAGASPDVAVVETPSSESGMDVVHGTDLDHSGPVAVVSEPVVDDYVVDQPSGLEASDPKTAVAAQSSPVLSVKNSVPAELVANPSVEHTGSEEKVSDKSGYVVAAVQVIEQQPKPSAGENAIVDNVEHKVKIKLLSDGIAHAQLTHSLDNEKKPVDTLSKQIRMNTEGLLRIYLYTELNGLSGTTLYHTWYLNGDRMARVRIPVVREDYRASSSKFIDTMMLGAWQVTITDDSDKLYADVSFVVTN